VKNFSHRFVKTFEEKEKGVWSRLDERKSQGLQNLKFTKMEILEQGDQIGQTSAHWVIL
jgi:hypothetical protein